jgi:hypothetical protein
MSFQYCIYLALRLVFMSDIYNHVTGCVSFTLQVYVLSQYTEFEKCFSAGQGRKRQYGAINRGEMYEICQGYAGPDVSSLPVFLSSDTTVICKSMAAHPNISEFTTCF